MKSAAKKSSRQVLLDMNREGLTNAVRLGQAQQVDYYTREIARLTGSTPGCFETSAERTQRIYDEAMARS